MRNITLVSPAAVSGECSITDSNIKKGVSREQWSGVGK